MMLPTRLIILLAILGIVPLSSFAAERVALVIGNGKYAHVPQLVNPANDAREVAALLKTGGYEVTEVVDGTVKEMGVALRTFALAGKTATTAVFYFAGHGFEVAGQNYLAPVDAELAVDDSLGDNALDAALGFALDDETMSLESVLSEMRKQVPGLKVVVLDCCRDNPFARTRSWARSRSGGGGLAQVTEAQLPEGSMLVFSGEPGQQVPDGTGRHSPFTEALLGEMRGAAGAPMLTVFTGVATKVKGRQKPWIKFDGTGQSLHAFSTVALMPGSGVPEVKKDALAANAEMERLRADLAKAQAEREAASQGNAAEMARLQKELEEARAKVMTATVAPPISNPITMLKTDPSPAAFPASRGMEGSRAGEVREFGGIEMVWCPAGEFLMGSPTSEEGRDDDETQHLVKLTKGFWLAKTETTQGQWESVMASSVAALKASGAKDKTFGEVNATGRDVAMYFTSWEDAQTYLANLNGNNPLPEGWKWELPTEAQWEYACRAGTETETYAGALSIKGKYNAPALDTIAWYRGNSSVGYTDKGYDTSGWEEKQYPGGTAGAREVSLKKANDWGLYDMIGNVWEWCADWHSDYPSGVATDPTGATAGWGRVYRGGGWYDYAGLCRSAYRIRSSPGYRSDGLGFRVAAVPAGR